MKKTHAINLVLITAAMAACNRPLYQQKNAGYEDPGYSADVPAGTSPGVPGPGPGPGLADTSRPDSTNACPVESSALPPDYYDWYNGAEPFGSITVNFNINGFYAYRNPPPVVRVNPIRSLFTRTFANFPAAVHQMAANAMSAAAAAHSHAAPDRPGGPGNVRTTNHPNVARAGFGARVGASVHS
jgi:hypothetical protein